MVCEIEVVWSAQAVPGTCAKAILRSCTLSLCVDQPHGTSHAKCTAEKATVTLPSGSKKDAKVKLFPSLYRVVSDLGLEAKLDITLAPHMLRHSHASVSLEKGASIVTVRDRLVQKHQVVSFREI